MTELRRFEPNTKTLGEIAAFLGADVKNPFENIEITGICSNSQEIEEGDLFLALPGVKTHGGAFLPSAVERGARAVLTDIAGSELSSVRDSAIPVLVVPNPRSQSGYLADWFHASPSQSMYLAGITGTNGKTTTSYLLNQIWHQADFDSGVVYVAGKLSSPIDIPIVPINPESKSDVVQTVLSVMNERHVRVAVMEVSSHAIVQHRIDGVRFAAAGFTNLSQDHLDFHGTMENYYQAKRGLFEANIAERAFINIDNEYGIRLSLEISIPTSTLSLSNKKATWHFDSIVQSNRGWELSIRGEGGVLIEGHFNLPGEHNLENLLLAVAIAFNSGVDPLVIGNSLIKLKGAPGRLESIERGQKFIALVDYAHTPDAVERVLGSLQRVSSETRIIGVLGCGGNRDVGKRSLMGRALRNACDVAIFTSDNPRDEDPSSILQSMTEGIQLDDSALVIVDRREAIATAVATANDGDIVVVLGKGHESGQEIKGVKVPFDDRVELASAIEALT